MLQAEFRSVPPNGCKGGTIMDAVGSALSALSAFQKKSEVTANNIANVNTDKFKKSRTILTEGTNGGVSATVQQMDTPGIPKETIRDGQPVTVESSNVDLAEELTEMIPTGVGYKANLKTIQAQDEMLGTVLDITG